MGLASRFAAPRDGLDDRRLRRGHDFVGNRALAAAPRFDELGTTLALVALAMPFMALADVWSSAVRGLGAVARSQYPASIVQHVSGRHRADRHLLCRRSERRGRRRGAQRFFAQPSARWRRRECFLRLELPPASADGAARITSRAEWRHVAGSNLLISLFQAVRAPLIVVIAGAYVDVQQLAYYVAAQRLANVMSLGLLGISGFASPLISQYFALGDFSKLQRLAHLSARGAFGGALATALVLIGFGYELLGLFGAGFKTAYAAAAGSALRRTGRRGGRTGRFLDDHDESAEKRHVDRGRDQRARDRLGAGSHSALWNSRRRRRRRCGQRGAKCFHVRGGLAAIGTAFDNFLNSALPYADQRFFQD